MLPAASGEFCPTQLGQNSGCDDCLATALQQLHQPVNNLMPVTRFPAVPGNHEFLGAGQGARSEAEHRRP